jgi:hypothetical protein
MTTPQRHPFLDDLADDVTLVSTILAEPVTGRDEVVRIVKAGASLYRRQTPIFLGDVDGRGFFEYEVELTDGKLASGLVSMVRNDAGQVTRLHIAFSPLASVLSIVRSLSDLGIGDQTTRAKA